VLKLARLSVSTFVILVDVKVFMQISNLLFSYFRAIL